MRTCPCSVGDRFTLVVDRHELLELHDELVARAVVAEADRAEHEDLVDRRGELERPVDGRSSGGGRSFSTVPEVLDDRRYLLLLALDRDPSPPDPRLEEEHPLARSSEGAGGERVDLVELEERTRS